MRRLHLCSIKPTQYLVCVKLKCERLIGLGKTSLKSVPNFLRGRAAKLKSRKWSRIHTHFGLPSKCNQFLLEACMMPITSFYKISLTSVRKFLDALQLCYQLWASMARVVVRLSVCYAYMLSLNGARSCLNCYWLLTVTYWLWNDMKIIDLGWP